VSALGRSVTEPGSGTALSQSSGPQLYDLVQTDAAINPGNSGGPLLDMSGKVIGINTLVAGQAEAGVQAQGIGFAISINQARQLADQLVKNGKVDHAFLGISFHPLSPAQAKQLSLDSSQRGAVLMQVQSGSPAAQAGLKNGDIVTAIDGTKITGESTLGEIISQHKPGDKVKLEVATPNPNGSSTQSRTIEVTLGQKSSN
jgi:S1-C subfamily serine protease